jgi:transcriptional regulator with XRE-family HTH domain
MPISKGDTSPELLALRTDIGSRVKNARETRRMSRAQLATRVEADPDHLGRLERGEMWPGGVLIVRLCRELRVGADWLLFGEGPGPEGRKPFEVISGGASEAPPKVSELSEMPDIVASYIALEGASIPPAVVEKLKRFDYSGLRAQKLTIEHVRRLISVLDRRP